MNHALQWPRPGPQIALAHIGDGPAFWAHVAATDGFACQPKDAASRAVEVDPRSTPLLLWDRGYPPLGLHRFVTGQLAVDEVMEQLAARTDPACHEASVSGEQTWLRAYRYGILPELQVLLASTGTRSSPLSHAGARGAQLQRSGGSR
ncbi:hypothetical protein NGB36_14350 [Streptomyces sp. RB6PN25]|uniref:Uncharacterized protein n=1 Tax=Streptomyces humicola TaxID=2953240 RepID=A0ABT1PZ10_9ACTN|nr:hypothetical protein [Streptomyces humicola]MCQ4081755.1 hypothetical protein [Streptomyces humicola]